MINELPTNTSDSFHRLSYSNSLSIPNSEIEAQSTIKLVLLATKNQQTYIVRLSTLVLENPYNNTTRKKEKRKKATPYHKITNNQLLVQSQ